MTYEQLFSEWLESKGLSRKTVRDYSLYQKRIEAKGGLTQENCDLLCRHIRNVASRGFLKNYKEFLYLHAETKQERIRLKKIYIPPLKSKKRTLKNILTEEEVLELARNMPSEGSKLMVAIMFYCGLRISELLNIRMNDFNWNTWWENTENNGLLRVKRKGDKYQYVPVKSWIMEFVLEWTNKTYAHEEKTVKGQPIFPLSHTAFRDKLNKSAEKVLGRRINPHLLRHSFAVHLVKKGWDINFIKEFLGHENISTTEIYATVPKEEIIKKYAEL